MSQVETRAAAMSREALFAEIVRLAAAQVGADPAGVTPETHFHNDLGFDSLDDVEFAMNLEVRFEIAIRDDVAESIRTVGQAFEKVRELLTEHAQRAALRTAPGRLRGRSGLDRGRRLGA